MNPFKFGTIVEKEFFTDRVLETEMLKRKLDGENHLVLISPRRFGKSSLVSKVLSEIRRPHITVNMQQVLDVQDFSALLLKEIFELYPLEKIRHLMTHFRISPQISTNAVTGTFEVSLSPEVKGDIALEDTFKLLEKVSTPEKRLIVVLDEFQDILAIKKGLDKQLRSIIQKQKGMNYIFLGSQESMMTEIFEKKKSPFYHFGQLMHLKRIPEDDFRQYVLERLPEVNGIDIIVDKILAFTQCHPYYTQQLGAQVWELMTYDNIVDDVVEKSVAQLVQEHDLDYERLWNSMNRTDKGVLREMALGRNPMSQRTAPTSTTYSAIKRLLKAGLVIKEVGYQLEDPFFSRWLSGFYSK